MYKPNKFEAYELVDEQTYKRFGDRSLRYMDDGLMKILEYLRQELGPLTVNTWYWGGDKHWSGLRTPTSPWYSTYSGHSYGKALDIRSKKHSADEIRDFIKDNWDEIQKYSGVKGVRLESSRDAPTWCHLDVLHDGEGVYVFNK